MIFHRYRAHLEAELVKQELLLKFVIQDKEKIIHRQDEEIRHLHARIAHLELALRPQPTKPLDVKREMKPVETGETTWTAYLQNFMKEQEQAEKKAKELANGVHGQGGQGIHESPGGKAVGQDGGNEAVSGPAKSS